ncbi:hypothetical protein [Salipiger bermudensis]|uniref:hypothetical protein n=1 Tax=Salipiger TaxID=263377 RepID=UPI001CD4D12F|nr:hypothetical protein [Salipiger bermudensis]MCA0961520.1 hypothetical protein [Salipiger bermudensis]
MAYPDDQVNRPDPTAPPRHDDPRRVAPASKRGSKMTGILVAVVLVLGLIFAASMFLDGGETETAPAAVTDQSETTVPGDGAAAPATGEADDTAPVAPETPAD